MDYKLKDNKNIDDFVQRLSQALQIKTISYENMDMVDKSEFLKFHTFIEKSFPNVHRVLVKETINDFGILFKWEGTETNQDSILLMAHMDVVPVEKETENEWCFEPFSGNISDGYVWGRGALDMKSQLMGILEAVEGLIINGFKPRKTIYLAFGHDEEVGGYLGNAQMASYLQSKGIKLSMVLDEGGFIIKNAIAGMSCLAALIGIAEKGMTTLELFAESNGGHSSMPPNSTAIGRLAKSIYILEKKQFKANINSILKEFFKAIAPKMPLLKRIIFSNIWLFKPLIIRIFTKLPKTNALVRTTTAFTMIEGGFKMNVLPQQAKAVANFRVMPGETIEDVKKRVEKVIKKLDITVKVNDVSFNPSKISHIASNEYKVMCKTIVSVFPESVAAPYLTVGSTDSRYYQKIANQIFRFCPIEIESEDLERVHGVNERISIEGYKKMIEFFYLLIESL
ncbi:M20/M25/M40 family metallo-hydrolase [Ruminiclostridium herbifermentans]|uniref:M20/M25/M40 family metallo-hydrolase n=1 Tax=Ruminiclostridium herbifermentans TaxID=2488810 RepID=A0A4U7JAL2_9FIRM|nr:M20 family peptidase [Ruminiclostridium herbifermentans]QNU65638.1 M20/M25/M40 family metallo-hydrolase [Ruminiclostridium herbifermentans]